MEKQPKFDRRILAIGGLALLLVASPTIKRDVIGSFGQIESNQVIKTQAIAAYDSAFRQASPAAKFDIQYLNTNKITIDRAYSNRRKFLGILQYAFRGRQYQELTVNNACLANTAYDINGGSIEFHASGLLNSYSAAGNMPTAAANAEINPNNPDDLIIQSGRAGTENLNFSGLQTGDQLVPMDSHTKDIMATYGCKLGLVAIRNYTY